MADVNPVDKLASMYYHDMRDIIANHDTVIRDKNSLMTRIDDLRANVTADRTITTDDRTSLSAKLDRLRATIVANLQDVV